ncbi:MAG: anti-sigma factor [Candidatus Methylomirabilales bacterium]
MPTGKTYQLWLIRDGVRDTGGLFSVDDAGRAVLIVRPPQPLETYEAVGATVEPAGRSAGPTSPAGDRRPPTLRKGDLTLRARFHLR